jgi:hypothetical protein
MDVHANALSALAHKAKVSAVSDLMVHQADRMEKAMDTTVKPDQTVGQAPEWTPPLVECYETRPEVTAYSGGGDPWTGR